MRRRITFILTFCFLSALGINTICGKGTPHPLRFSIGTESVSTPSFSRIVKSPHPAISFGTEFYYRNRPKSSIFQSADLGYFYHKKLGSAAYLNSHFGYRRYVGNFFLEGRIGPGYMLSHSYASIYNFKDGQYAKATHLENKFIVSTGLSLGYRFSSILPFISYGLLAETPFLKNDSPVLPHQLLQVGFMAMLSSINDKQK